MEEGQFELDGYVFGAPGDPVVVLEDGLDTGAPSIRTNDAPNPVGDGGYFGRDFLDGPTWAFTLGVQDDEDVYTTLADLARVWRNEAVRKTPGAESILKFRRGGKTYRVYGRPRRFGVNPGATADNQWQIVEADFKMHDTVMYADESRREVLRLGDPTPDDGLVLPETLAWDLGTQSTSTWRSVSVSTFEPTPFLLEIRGPASGAMSQVTVEGMGWAFDLDMAIPANNVVRIDTRDMTAQMQNESVAGALSRRSRLNARITSGNFPFFMSANGDTMGAYTRVTWHTALPIL